MATQGLPEVSVIIPTLRRPKRLAGAARSVLAQAGVPPDAVELLVVDNDPAGSARETVEQLGSAAPFPVRYVAVPEPGIANARNAGVAAARGTLIVFIDDDEEAPPHWLAALVEAERRFDADVVFGPVRARVPESISTHRRYFERFFSRTGPDEAGLTGGYHGCGNSLLRRAALPNPVLPFAAERNEVGGEDDLLFAQMQARGARFAWAPDAWVWEEAVPERLTLRYTLKRAFTYGQGPSVACVSTRPRRWGKLLFWMAVGFGQALVFGAIAAMKWAMGASDRAIPLDRAVQGLGKIFWFSPFRVGIYGAAAVRPRATQP